MAVVEMLLTQVFLALSTDSFIHVFDYYDAALKVGWMTCVAATEMTLWLVCSAAVYTVVSLIRTLLYRTVIMPLELA